MQGNGETDGRPQGVAATNPLQQRDGWDREVQGFYIQTIRKQQHVLRLLSSDSNTIGSCCQQNQYPF